jgi:hypothetical protein
LRDPVATALHAARGVADVCRFVRRMWRQNMYLIQHRVRQIWL